MSIRELLPDTWYVENGKIIVTNPDGTQDVLDTNWYELDEAALERRRIQLEKDRLLKEHLAEKRILREKERNGRGK